MKISTVTWLAGSWIALWFIFFTYFWSNSVFFDAQGNVMVTSVNIWGDWAAHFTMGSHLAYRDLTPDTSPLLYGESFGYPFAAEWVSAVLIRAGVPFFSAFILPSFVFSVLMIILLLLLYRHLLGGWAIAVLASFFFLCNGGLGFTRYISDISLSTEPLVTAFNPPREYTNIEPEFIRWISVIQSMMIPQRAFVLGFTAALLALTLLHKLSSSSIKTLSHSLRWMHLASAALVLGLLPILHTHSFLAMFIILACWSVGEILATKTWALKRRVLIKWTTVVVLTAFVALPLLNHYFFGHVTTSFWKWHPGWYSFQEPDLDWLSFWFTNWGVVPLLAMGGWWWLLRQTRTREEKIRTFFWFAPFFLLFAGVNLVLFQPFIWDNTKILVWASLGFSGLAAVFVKAAWEQLPQLKLAHPSLTRMARVILGALIIGAIIFSTLSGTVDALRIIKFPLHTYQMYSREEMELVHWVKAETDHRAVWLTGDQHNHWLYNLTGRQPLLTYRGWLWTHGYQYHEIDADLTRAYTSPQNSQDVFQKYQIRFAVIGPNERHTWKANETAFRQEFMVLKETPHYVIFDTSSALTRD